MTDLQVMIACFTASAYGEGSDLQVMIASITTRRRSEARNHDLQISHSQTQG